MVPRQQDYIDSVVSDSWDDQHVAEEDFRAAQIAVANIASGDMSELALKACLSSVYDKVQLSGGQSAVIGYSVALNLISLTLAVAS